MFPWPLDALREWYCARTGGHNWMLWFEPGFLVGQKLCIRCKKRSHL